MKDINKRHFFAKNVFKKRKDTLTFQKPSTFMAPFSLPGYDYGRGGTGRVKAFMLMAELEAFVAELGAGRLLVGK